MFKFIYLISILLLFTSLPIQFCSSYRCIHDHIFPKSSTHLARSVKYQDIKSEREGKRQVFEPLELYFYVDITDKSVSDDTVYNVQLQLKKIKSFIAKTFEVRKRARPFRLEREVCSHRWQMGINRGKCSDYYGDIEQCSTKGVTYQIPDIFIEKLEIYDFHNPEPKLAIPPGAGLNEANFLTFIVSENSEYCEEEDVSAYGTYCRVDRNTNEPLAGIINLCPQYFAKKVYPSDHYYNVILHELFHILGFSGNLFERYTPCQKGVYCDVPKHIIQDDDEGNPRMMFPLVIKEMQKHFNCPQQSFGGPMDNPEQGNESGVTFHSSHWHPVLMYSSIMAPSFSEYDHVFTDIITLAVFASSGWYKINFTNAENFQFGLNEGCDFGVKNETCENSRYLCIPSKNETGCDIENKAFGICTSLVSYHPCGVYKSFSAEDCESDTNKLFVLDFNSLGYERKCFVFRKSDNIKPFCLPLKCKSTNAYDILVNATWYSCPIKKTIEVGNTTVYCPETSFCSKPQETRPQYFCPAETEFFIAVRMYFQEPNFKALSDYQNFKNFKVTTLRGIADEIEIPVNYIVNSSLSVFKNIFLDFAICPPTTLQPTELVSVLMKTQSFLDSGSFMHILKGPTNIISSSDIKIDPSDTIAFSDYDGFRVLLIFPFMAAAFLVVTIVASLVRLYLIQRHRPRRAVEQQQSSSNMEMS